MPDGLEFSMRFEGLEKGKEAVKVVVDYQNALKVAKQVTGEYTKSKNNLAEAMRLEREIQKTLSSNTLLNIKEKVQESSANKRVTQSYEAMTLSGNKYTAQLVYENGVLKSANQSLKDGLKTKQKEITSEKTLTDALKRSAAARENIELRRVAARERADAKLKELELRRTANNEAANNRLLINTKAYEQKRALIELRASNKAVDAERRRAQRILAEQEKLAQQSQLAAQKNIDTVKSLVSAYILGRGVYAFLGGLREAVQTSKELSIRIAEIQTISQQLPLSTARWQKELVQVSNTYGIDILDQAEAAYQALSNQIGEGAEVLSFLNKTNQFAITTQATATESVQLLTAAIKSYGLTAADTDEVAATMFKTIELGRIRASELANSFGQVGPLAKTLNIDMVELSASLEVLTIRGIKTDEAMTLMRNIMNSLIKPTDSMKALLADLGVASGEAAVQLLGWPRLLGEIEKRSAGSSTELGKLYRRIRAIVGGVVFTGQGLDQLNENITEHQNAQIDYMNATEIALKAPGRVIQTELTQVKNFFVEDFGNAVIGTLAGIDAAGVDLSTTVAGMATIIAELGGAYMLYRIGAFTKALYNAAAAAKVLSASSAGIAGIVAAVGYTIGNYIAENIAQNQLDAIADMERAHAKMARSISDNIHQQLKPAYDDLEAAITINGDKLRFQRKEVTGYIGELVNENEVVTANLNKMYGDLQNAMHSMVTDSQKRLKDIAKELEAIDAAVVSITNDTKDFITSLELEFAGSLEEKLEIIRRETAAANVLIKEAATAKEVEDARKNVIALLKQEKDLLVQIEKQKIKNAQQDTKEALKKKKERLKAIDEGIKDSGTIRLSEMRERARIQAEIVALETRSEELNKASSSALEARKEIQQQITAAAQGAEKAAKDQLATIKAINEAAQEFEKKNEEELIRKEIELEQLLIEAKRFKFKGIGVDSEDEITKQKNRMLSIREFAKRIYANDYEKRKAILMELAKLEIELKDKVAAEARKKQIDADQKALAETAEKERAKLKKAEAKLELPLRRVGVRLTDLKESAKVGGSLRLARTDEEERFRKALKKLDPNNLGAIAEFINRYKGVRFGAIPGLSAGYTVDQTTEFKALERSLKAAQAQVGKVDEVKKEYAELRARVEKQIPVEERLTDAQKGNTESNYKLIRSLDNLTAAIAGRPDRIDPNTFAYGGSVGSDSVHAMLTPGEYVVNARSARKYRSQLSAINNDLQARNMGGPITNLNGGINVSVNSSGDSRVDGTVIAKTIRRELRRKTLRIG